MEQVATVNIKYGPIDFYTEEIDGGYRAVSMYRLVAHPILAGKVMTSKSKLYKSINGAKKEAMRQAEYNRRNN